MEASPSRARHRFQGDGSLFRTEIRVVHSNLLDVGGFALRRELAYRWAAKVAAQLWLGVALIKELPQCETLWARLATLGPLKTVSPKQKVEGSERTKLARRAKPA